MKFINAHGVEYVPNRWLTFDDVTLMPQYSNIPSRNDPSIKLDSKLTPEITLPTPIISANMDTVTGARMAIALGRLGGLGILHRFYPSKDLWWADIQQVVTEFNAVAFSVGLAESDADLVGEVLSLTENVIVCVDTAHGDSQKSLLQIKRIKTNFPAATIIGGNVCTPDGAERLISQGASVAKVGISSGSCCSTRVITGHGMPLLSSIIAIRNRINNLQTNTGLIADGGIRNSGDAVKALAAGANCVMLGRIFAGAEETPETVVETPDGPMKRYRGQSSADFMASIGKSGVTPEGVSGLVPYTGPVENTMLDFLGGIRSGMTYSGARTLSGDPQSLNRKAIFAEISTAAYIEGTPHGKLYG